MRTLSALAAFVTVLLLTASASIADTYPRQAGIDVLHYAFHLTLRDETDVIDGEAEIDLRFVDGGLTGVALDLVNEREGKGMTVSSVRCNGEAAVFEHASDRLTVTLPAPSVKGTKARLVVVYRGTPANGLRIGPNLHGERTFFSDNWPNKARHWLPTVDHPYDKATSELLVTAPSHYQVISNGVLVEETDLPGDRRLTHWKQSVPIATWLYVLGAARFAVDRYDDYDGRSLESWVYPRDREAGFHDFSYPVRATLEFFSEHIGPYAYEKLANVQSASVGGGMEAATAIFYGQDLVKGQRDDRVRNVIIHEIAHQWWGNAVTESDWNDVWLSEGFATYFTLLFREHAYGRDDFLRGLAEARKRVLEFHEKRPDYRIVHENLDDMSTVTTSQTYQKGAYVLHMLRGRVGDDAFWQGVRLYYRRFMNGSATTTDFRQAMEEASGLSLERFFEQWLYRGGLPRVEGSWRWANGSLEVVLRQVQTEPDFELEVPLAIRTGSDAAPRFETVPVAEREVHRTIPLDAAPAAVELDPELAVLMVGSWSSQP